MELVVFTLQTSLFTLRRWVQLPPRRLETRRWDYDDITHALSLIAKEFHIAIWTATQATAESLKYGVKDLRALSEGKIAKSKHLSVGFGIDSTQSVGRQKWTVFKKRRADRGNRSLFVTTSKYRLVG